MSESERKDELLSLFSAVDESERNIVDRLIDELIFLENRMQELKKLPFVSVHPAHPALQKVTAAAKIYKECSQSYMNGIRILLSVLRNAGSSAEEDLLRKLEEFS